MFRAILNPRAGPTLVFIIGVGLSLETAVKLATHEGQYILSRKAQRGMLHQSLIQGFQDGNGEALQCIYINEPDVWILSASKLLDSTDDAGLVRLG